MNKRLLTGLQPTGNLTIGNYAGSIKQVIDMQEKYDVFLFIADLHAITTGKINKEELEKNSLDNLALYLASGVNEDKATIFLQSDVKEHANLAYLLLCNTNMGDLNRMTQYKDKSLNFKQANGTESIPVGIFVYPALMAADILLYDSSVVPVGKDQKQHVELARNYVEKLNKQYPSLFTMPEPYIASDSSAKIMSLQEPTKKMSKSDTNKNATIFLLDDEKTVEAKIKKAVTDSEGIVKYDPINKPGVSNLMTLIKVASGKEYETIEKELEGKHYGFLKEETTKAINSLLSQIQKKYNELIKTDKIKNVLENGYKKAQPIAEKKLNNVLNNMGFLTKEKR